MLFILVQSPRLLQRYSLFYRLDGKRRRLPQPLSENVQKRSVNILRQLEETDKDAHSLSSISFSGTSHSSIGLNCVAAFSSLLICFSSLFLRFSSLAFTIAGSSFFFFFKGSALGISMIFLIILGQFLVEMKKR